MADWQYKSNAIPVSQGWQMTTPDHSPSSSEATAKIVDQDGQEMYLWLHQIDASYQNGGSFAQSARKRDWYARNLTQVSMTLTGQCANQKDYHKLVEFVRQTQRQSLRWKDSGMGTNSVRLIIPRTHRHTAYDMHGHIAKIDRTSERFVFAPEYSFDFLITSSTQGVFRTSATNAHVQLRMVGPWMAEF